MEKEASNKLLDNIVDTAKNYGGYALLASLAAGGINSYLSSRSKPINETPAQRRKRLLRSFLLPSGLTLGAAGTLGLTKALLNTDTRDLIDSQAKKSLENQDKKEEDKKSGSWKPWVAGGALSGGLFLGSRTNLNNSLVDLIMGAKKKSKPRARAILSILTPIATALTGSGAGAASGAVAKKLYDENK